MKSLQEAVSVQRTVFSQVLPPSACVFIIICMHYAHFSSFTGRTMTFLVLLTCFLLTSASAFLSPLRDGRHNGVVPEATKHQILSLPGKGAPAIAGIITSQFVVDAVLAYDDLEVADLPPAYVPVAFGVLLLGGVGWLTSSLGDIMTEESLLGLQSGARAKKEMERSKSSFFKKRR